MAELLNVNGLLENIKNAGTVAVAGHQNPDGDVIGACFAFALFLKALGKTPIIILDEYSSKFDFLTGGEFVRRDDLAGFTPDVLVCLDCATTERLGLGRDLLTRCGVSYNIDHHVSNTNFADYNWVDPAASSTSEMIYGVIAKTVNVSAEMAANLYAGIICDTGCFRHKSTTPQTLRAAAELMETGICFTDIQRRVIYEHSPTETKIFGLAAANVCFEPSLKLAYACLTAEMMESAGATGTDLDGVVEYLLNIVGVEVSALLSHRETGFVNVSLRSVRLDVGRVAAAIGGGGHMYAAGAKVRMDMDEALTAIVNAINKEVHG